MQALQQLAEKAQTAVRQSVKGVRSAVPKPAGSQGGSQKKPAPRVVKMVVRDAGTSSVRGTR